AETRIPQYQQLGVGFRYEHALQDFSPAFRETEMGKYFARTFQERNRWADADTIVEMFRALNEADPDWLHAGVKAPTLIITGSLDNAHERSFALQERIAGCELVTIEGAGHSCNMEQPWLWDRHFLAVMAQHNRLGADSRPRPPPPRRANQLTKDANCAAELCRLGADSRAEDDPVGRPRVRGDGSAPPHAD